jgi:hypothetical protein
MSVAKVDFGRVDAESEKDTLEAYFIDTGVLGKLRDGRKHFVIGRKGSGKTALFQLANLKTLGQKDIPLDFSHYPWELHKYIRESGLAPESAYVASWRFTFLANACRFWAENATPPIQRQAADYLTRIYGKDKPGFLEMLFDGFRRIRRVDLPSVEGLGSLGGIELQSVR